MPQGPAYKAGEATAFSICAAAGPVMRGQGQCASGCAAPRASNRDGAAWPAAIPTSGRKNEAAFRLGAGSLDAAAASDRLPPPHMARRGALRTAAPRDGQYETWRGILLPRMRSQGARRILGLRLATRTTFFFCQKGASRARAAWCGGWMTWGAQRGSRGGPKRYGSAHLSAPRAIRSLIYPR